MIPATSTAARLSISATHLEDLVYETIREFGLGGAISDEVRAKLPWLAYSSVTARFHNLVESGRIRVIGARKGSSGRSQRVMVAV
jgi:hypothetical protein